MSKNIYEILNVVTSIPDDSLIYAATPGGSNPDPFEDSVIEKGNLFLPLQTQITTNADAITLIEADVIEIQNNSVKQIFTSRTTGFTFTQDKDEHLELIIFRQVTGTSTVSVGKDLSFTDILSERVIDSTRYRNTDIVVPPAVATRNINVDIVSGSVDLVVFSKRLVFGL